MLRTDPMTPLALAFIVMGSLAAGCVTDVAGPEPEPPADGGSTEPADAGARDGGTHGDGGVPPDGGGSGDVWVAEPQSGTTINTAAGTVTGEDADGLRVFKGIPFAEAPIGERRFTPPLPKAPWEGTRAATAFGPSCPQGEVALFGTGDGGQSEDCLSLNIWAHDDGIERPVMVFIYGGGFMVGTSAQGLYDGAHLAQNGDVTVVTLNYRLGALGWLASPALAEDLGVPAAGNYGLYDQIEALRWVKQNIRAFGGDPDNVTIFGESAGAISVCALLGAPTADDLFHKAIIESGMCALAAYEGSSLIGMPSASELSENVIAAVGCDDAFDIADCLRSKTTDELLEASSLIDLLTGDLQAVSALSPVVDGILVPQQPIDRMRQGGVTKPIIVGSNKDEGVLFTGADVIVTRIGLQNKFESLLGEGDHIDTLMDLYPFLEFPVVKDAWVAFMGEVMFICPGLAAAETSSAQMPVFTYHFERTPLALAAVGSIHGLELPYVFGTFGAMGLIPTFVDDELSEVMQSAWSQFAYTGTPTLVPAWARYDAASPQIVHFDANIAVEPSIRNGRCAVLQDLGIVY